MEHAEMYKEQLLRSEPMIFADIEDENNWERMKFHNWFADRW
jgi:hypothetical protein